MTLSDLPPVLLVCLFLGVLLAPCSGSGDTQEALRLLSGGDQSGAEKMLNAAISRDPADMDAVFLASVCARSRFDLRNSALGFLAVAQARPDSPDGMASACALGLDLSPNLPTALYYFNALLILADRHPDSIPIHWLAAVMVRTLTRDRSAPMPGELRKLLLRCGIAEYGTVLSLMAPGRGPVLVHQTLANLLDDSEAYDDSWEHRELALKMEAAPWSLHTAAMTLLALDRANEALPLARAAVVADPETSAYQQTLGDALSALGNHREAVEKWELASRLDERNTGLLKICAMGHRRLGDYAAARRCTQKALAVAPDDRTMRIWDARFAVMLGEKDAAARLAEAGTFDFQGKPVPFAVSGDPWFRAAQTGDLDALRKLLPTADVNARDREGFDQTALMKAASAGWENIAAELVKAGATLDLADANGDTALHYSANFGQPRLTKLLLEAGANPNLQDKWKQTPLIMCAFGRNAEGFDLLVADKKTDINLATPHGGTALHYAAGHGDLPMVSALLARGADVNKPSANSGDTPLIAACREWAHSYLIAPLIAAGADVNARDKAGRTALLWSVTPLLNAPLVNLLLDKGADPSLADNSGMTPIARARLLGFEEIARAMEAKAGKATPFELPLPAGSAAAPAFSPFTLPLLLAAGRLPETPGRSPDEIRESARRELARSFAIGKRDTLMDSVKAFEEFQPRLREAGNLPGGIAPDSFQSLLKAAAAKTHALCGKTDDPSAWTNASIIYLLELGARAGFIPPDEAAPLIAGAEKTLRERFASWDGFLDSVVLGARLHKGWDARRFEHIRARILESAPPWP